MDYLNITQLIPVEIDAPGRILLRILPMQYLDGRNPRLPRRSAPNYPTLRKDTAFCVGHSCRSMQRNADTPRYRISIVVYEANDGLGGADLDNYCKPVLDAITSTVKVWKDDKQIDELTIKRVSTTDTQSSIAIEIAHI
jgi:Endodeoxyribonuclease RusA